MSSNMSQYHLKIPIYSRYNDSIVKGICRSLQDSPVALEEFLRLCIPLFASDQDFLFDKLINLVAEDPDKVIDAWEVMQEVFFTPNNTMLKQMAHVLKSHGREIPFVIDEEEIPFEEVKETKQKKKKKKKTESDAEVKKESKKDEYLDSFRAEIAKQNLDEATTMLLTVHIYNTYIREGC